MWCWRLLLCSLESYGSEQGPKLYARVNILNGIHGQSIVPTPKHKCCLQQGSVAVAQPSIIWTWHAKMKKVPAGCDIAISTSVGLSVLSVTSWQHINAYMA